jgi:hypothetical protein
MSNDSKIRVCELDDCDVIIDIDSNPKKRFCCVEHGSLFRVRKQRLKNKNKVKPYIITGITCPVDGKVFPVKLYYRIGRPKKYDCDSCRDIARQIRLANNEKIQNNNKDT